MAVKEIAGGVVGSKPASMQKKIVDLVGENQLLNFHVFSAQTRDQIDGLGEDYVAIIIAVNE